jgi:hypothetical protein
MNTTLKISIGNKNIELSIEEAKQLKFVLDDMFKDNEPIRIPVSPLPITNPFPAWPMYPTYPTYPIITCEYKGNVCHS